MPWDGKKLPDALAFSAVSAAAAAANGAKNAAYLSYIQGQIGSNYRRKLVRWNESDVPTTVWQATATGTLPIVGSAFVLTGSGVTQNSIATADIDTGAWVHYIENASDPTKYIATAVTKTGGAGPAVLSADLLSGGSLSLGTLSLASPAYDVVVPSDVLTLTEALKFRSLDHMAPLGMMPRFFDWSERGRPYNTNTNAFRTSDTRIVPWHTIFAAGTADVNSPKSWPTNIGVQVGDSELWAQPTDGGAWVRLRYWTTHHRYKHNRDDYGVGVGAEDAGTNKDGTQTQKLANDGTKIVRRADGGDFNSGKGTHIHGFYELAGDARVPINRTLYRQLAFRYRCRAVGWPASDGQSPAVNPSWDQTSIVALAACDTYSADGDFQTTYGGDIGIARAIYVTNEWKDVLWYSSTQAVFSASPPPFVTV